MWLHILSGITGGLLFIVLLGSLICFFEVFYSPKRRTLIVAVNVNYIVYSMGGYVPRAINLKSIKDIWLLRRMYGGSNSSMPIFSTLCRLFDSIILERTQISQVR